MKKSIFLSIILLGISGDSLAIINDFSDVNSIIAENESGNTIEINISDLTFRNYGKFGIDPIIDKMRDYESRRDGYRNMFINLVTEKEFDIEENKLDKKIETSLEHLGASTDTADNILNLINMASYVDSVKSKNTILKKLNKIRQTAQKSGKLTKASNFLQAVDLTEKGVAAVKEFSDAISEGIENSKKSYDTELALLNGYKIALKECNPDSAITVGLDSAIKTLETRKLQLNAIKEAIDINNFEINEKLFDIDLALLTIGANKVLLASLGTKATVAAGGTIGGLVVVAGLSIKNLYSTHYASVDQHKKFREAIYAGSLHHILNDKYADYLTSYENYQLEKLFSENMAEALRINSEDRVDYLKWFKKDYYNNLKEKIELFALASNESKINLQNMRAIKLNQLAFNENPFSQIRSNEGLGLQNMFPKKGGFSKSTPENPKVDEKNIVFLLDISGSMENGSRLFDVKSAIKKLFANLTNRQYMVELISFGNNQIIAGHGQLVQLNNKNWDDCIQFVEQLSAGGGTPTVKAVKTALDYPDVQSIVLLSDGEPTDNTKEEAFKKIINYNRKKLHIYTVGVGLQMNDKNSDERKFMEKLAEQTGGFFRKF